MSDGEEWQNHCDKPMKMQPYRKFTAHEKAANGRSRFFEAQSKERQEELKRTERAALTVGKMLNR